MNEKKFNQLYRQLNKEQKEAVDGIEGPVMVVAGPGTGKTQILALRIANILLKTDTHPSNILAITFTDSGVISMRRRLADIIGSPAYSVVINTFHGFCNDVIKNHPEEFPHIIGSQSINEVDQLKILEEIILGSRLDILKPFGDTTHYLKPALAAINALKREGVRPDVFKRAMERESQKFPTIPDLYHKKGAHKGKMKNAYRNLLKRLEKNKELAVIYAEYQKRLAAEKYYDFSDMIMEAAHVLSNNNDLLVMLQEEHQYILVDEHQDTNSAQNNVLELLCNFHKNPNIFVVGDEKQAIFRFQGASIENFNHFKEQYPEATLVILKENYRSTQTILDSAEGILSGDEILRANVSHKNNPVRLAVLSSPEAEYYFIAKDILRAQREGALFEEIAVLYRDNNDAFPIARILEKFNIPFYIESDQNILEDDEIKKLILLFRVIGQFGAPDTFFEAMHIDFLDIAPLDLYKMASYAREKKISILEIARSTQAMRALRLESTDRILHFYKTMASLSTFNKNRGLADLFEATVRESGFLSHILEREDAVEKIEKINGLFDEAREVIEKHKDATLQDFMDYLEMIAHHGISIKKKGGLRREGRVRLMTAHKSKGLEFDYVYITGAFDGHWGNRQRADHLPLLLHIFKRVGDAAQRENDANDDERRLFYVALTRARKEAVISYAKTGSDHKERLVCQFAQEIRPELIVRISEKEYEQEFSGHKEILFAPPSPARARIKDKKFVRELFLHHGLSVTAINNYLECPWKYFYTNLLRIPKASSKHQMFGTAVHGALKDFFNILKERGSAQKELLLEKFHHYLNAQSLSSSDFAESMKKGTVALSGYYDAYRRTWNTNTLNEFNIAGILLENDVRITGKLDKLEIVDAQGGVNVVDYKTGKYKSRREIEGMTKQSNGNIKRQLVFYRLLLDKYERGKWRMVSGEIDFVEPDTNGRYKKEKFHIEKEDVEELETLIKKIALDILGLKFWNRYCDDPKCAFCGLRKMMKSGS